MSIPSQQTALAILTPRGAWGLIPTGVDLPGPGELLVRVEATALNPADWKLQATEYASVLKEYPAILGADAAGVVVAVGEGVTNFAVGERTLHEGEYTTNRLATFKQYTIVSANLAAKIPDGISFDQAATLPLGLGTAVVGLYQSTQGRGGAGLLAPWKEGGRGKYAGQPIVIFGGSSSVGQFVIQCAKLSGFSPIITTVSPHNDELVKSLGATHTINRSMSTDQIVAAVKTITPEPVKVVYDAISMKSTQDPAYDVLSPGGILVLVLGLVIDKAKLVPEKKTIFTFGMVHTEDNKEFGQEFYSHITEYLTSGDIKPNPVEILPHGLLGGIEGLGRLQADKVSGAKLIARPQETAPLK